jgi:predicted molibdopterin-dependent oxidoreductase YjgC
MTNSIPEIEDADCLFVIGSNTSEAHPLVAHRIFRAIEKGAKLIVVDPRKTQVAELADIHASLKFGTDVAFLNGIMNEIVTNNWHNSQFVSDRTEGFETFNRTIQNYPADKVSAICGISADVIREIARLYATAGTSSILYTLGITEHSHGVDNVKSLANLAMLTGQIGKPSSGVNPLRGQNNVQGACDMGALPNVYPGY